jgi:hypothetical protein
MIARKIAAFLSADKPIVRLMNWAFFCKFSIKSGEIGI